MSLSSPALPNASPGSGEPNAGPAQSGQPQPSVRETGADTAGESVTTDQAAGQLPADVQAKLAELENLRSLSGRQGQELGVLKNIERAIASDPKLYTQVMQRLNPAFPGQTSPYEEPSSNGNGNIDGLEQLAAKAVEQTAGLDTEAAKQSLVAFGRQVVQQALSQMAPVLNQAQQTAINTQWERERTTLLQKTGNKLDIMSPEERPRLEQAILELKARMGLPANFVIAPDVVVKYAYGDMMHAAGQQSQQALEQERIQRARNASGTARPGPSAGAPTARPRTILDYVERERSKVG